MNSLKELRTKRGITQAEIARKLGVTQGAVSQWELGATDPDIRYLLPLADILGCTVEELLRPEARSASPTDDGTTVGNKIRQARALRGLSQAQLAQKLCVTKQTISNYENGLREPDFGTLGALADVLGVTRSWLIGDEELLRPEARNPGPTDDGMTFGEKLKALRKDRGLTLQDVGDRVGVGRSTVRKWETGEIANVRRDKIDRIAEALRADPAYLMGWTEAPDARDTGPNERRQTMEGYPTTVLNLTPLSVTTEDAAKITGISTKTLRALIRRGAFPSVHIGRKIVIPTAAIERWLDEHIGERVEAGDEDW